jgi:hypothetical protein
MAKNVAPKERSVKAGIVAAVADRGSALIEHGYISSALYLASLHTSLAANALISAAKP